MLISDFMPIKVVCCEFLKYLKTRKVFYVYTFSQLHEAIIIKNKIEEFALPSNVMNELTLHSIINNFIRRMNLNVDSFLA